MLLKFTVELSFYTFLHRPTGDKRRNVTVSRSSVTYVLVLGSVRPSRKVTGDKRLDPIVSFFGMLVQVNNRNFPTNIQSNRPCP